MTGTLNPTKGFTVSDNSIPTPPDAQPTPPPPAPAPPAPPAQPYQAYPGAAPSVAPSQGYPTSPQPPQYAPQQPYGSAVTQPYGAAAQPPYYAASAPGQPGAGYPSYGATPYPAPRPASGLAITSLICGIAGVVLFWAVVPLLASIVAVITGHMALRQTKQNPAIGGRGMAFAGLIMGYTMVGFLVIGIVMTVISAVFFGAFTLPFLFSA
ncbi:DUF4190 domain-containing protein [Microbacterium sp. K2]|uniref:DUF4190 domain-containing protein n=1 Tax=Microbacterium sp. K2 TaxID=3391827 RepID=UPI003ED86F64